MCERGSTLVRARQHAKGDIAITPGMGLGSNGPAKVRGLGGRSAHRGGQADHDHARMTRFKRRGGSRPEYNGGVAKGRPQVTCSGARGDGHLSRPSEGAWHRGGRSAHCGGQGDHDYHSQELLERRRSKGCAFILFFPTLPRQQRRSRQPSAPWTLRHRLLQGPALRQKVLGQH